jgi:hypothetical protein
MNNNEKYYITWDLEKTLIGWLRKSDNQLIRVDKYIRNLLIKTINSSFDRNVTEFVSYDNCKDFFEWLREDEEFILALEDGIYIDNADFYFSSTRAYNSQNDVLENPKSYSIMQRNWTNIILQDVPLKDTISKSWKNEIVICDDWLFSWDTLQKVIQELLINWVKIKEIRVILNFSWINEIFWIPIISMYKPSSCIDWLDERDLFYWTKNWGASFFYNWWLNGLPYIFNPEIATKKASIPRNVSKKFCLDVLDLNSAIWEQVNSILRRDIKLVDLPRIWYLQERYSLNDDITAILLEERFRTNN